MNKYQKVLPLIDISEAFEHHYLECEKEYFVTRKKREIAYSLIDFQNEFTFDLRSINEDDRIYFNVEVDFFQYNDSKKHLNKGSYSIHLQLHDSKVGVLRIEYGRTASHNNPVEVPDGYPAFLEAYKNRTIKENTPHLHIYTDQNRNVAMPWAIPLSDIKNLEIRDISTNEDEMKSIDEFFKLANIITKVIFQTKTKN